MYILVVIANKSKLFVALLQLSHSHTKGVTDSNVTCRLIGFLIVNLRWLMFSNGTFLCTVCGNLGSRMCYIWIDVGHHWIPLLILDEMLLKIFVALYQAQKFC